MNDSIVTAWPISVQAAQEQAAERLRLGLLVRIEWRAPGPGRALHSCSMSLQQLERLVRMASGNQCYRCA